MISLDFRHPSPVGLRFAIGLLTMCSSVPRFVPAVFGQGNRVSELISQLKDADEKVRRDAAKALGEFKNPRAVGPLIALLKDTDLSVRINAATALGEIKDPRAVDPLIGVLKDTDYSGRVFAAVQVATLAVQRAQGVAVAPGLRQIKDPRAAAALSLGKIKDPRAVEPLIAALKDENVVVRGVAAGSLGEFNDPRAVEPLIAALKDEYTREHAALSLGKITDAPAVLITALKDPNPDVRRGVATALGEIKDTRVVEPLIAALKDPSPDVRRNVATALGESKDPRVVEPLIAALKDADSFVRRIASFALGEIKDPRAVEPLIAALKDGDLVVKKGAADALGKFEAPRAVEALIASLKDAEVGQQVALELINSSDPRGASAVLALVKEGDSRVTASVWKILIAMGEPGSEDVLIESLNSAWSGGVNEAEGFVNSGNKKLEEAGRHWAADHGYSVREQMAGEKSVEWVEWGARR